MKKLIAFIFLFSVGAEAKTFKIDYRQSADITGSLVGYESESIESAQQEIIDVIGEDCEILNIEEIEPINFAE